MARQEEMMPLLLGANAWLFNSTQRQVGVLFRPMGSQPAPQDWLADSTQHDSCFVLSVQLHIHVHNLETLNSSVWNSVSKYYCQENIRVIECCQNRNSFNVTWLNPKSQHTFDFQNEHVWKGKRMVELHPLVSTNIKPQVCKDPFCTKIMSRFSNLPPPQEMTMPPTAQKIEVTRWPLLQHFTVLEPTQTSTHHSPCFLLQQICDNYVCIKQTYILLLYIPTFPWFFK